MLTVQLVQCWAGFVWVYALHPQIPEAKNPFWEQQSPVPPTALSLLTPQSLTRCIKYVHLIFTGNEVEVVEVLAWVP